MLIGNYTVLNKSPGRFFAGSSTAGAGQAQSRANWSTAGPLRGVHYQDGATASNKLWGHPEGAVLMPYTQGMMTSRYEAALAIESIASAVMGYPISGDAAIALIADAIGDLISSGSGVATVGVMGGSATMTGILQAVGSAGISIITNGPLLGAEASCEGTATISISSAGSILPTDDADPSRTASATISMTCSLTPYGVGHMVGSALPYTELSPQSMAQAVWSAIAADNNQDGTMGSKVNTASSGGVDLEALAEAVLAANVEGSVTIEGALRVLLAVAAGKTDITGTTVTFRDLADAKSRVIAVMDGSERSSVTLNTTD